MSRILAALDRLAVFAAHAELKRDQRLAARYDCHGSRWCCQYCDTPHCNSANDPHLIARWVYRWQQRRAS